MPERLVHFAGLSLFLLFLSCRNNTHEKKIKEIIKLPAHVESYNPYIKHADTLDNKPELFIYTLVDVSCSTCILKLDKWNAFASAIKKERVAIRPICFSEDHFETLKYLFENNQVGKIDFPLILDLDNKFTEENRNLVKMGELTALTNNRNEVLLTGKPIENAKDREKFLEKINEITNQKDL